MIEGELSRCLDSPHTSRFVLGQNENYEETSFNLSHESGENRVTVYHSDTLCPGRVKSPTNKGDATSMKTGSKIVNEGSMVFESEVQK